MSSKGKKILLFVVVLMALVGSLLFIFRQTLVSRFFSATESTLPVGIENSTQLAEEETLQTVAENLNVPWDIAQLPDGDLLVTERAGTIKRIGASVLEYSIPEVQQTAEGGLLGIALHPTFETNQQLYVYMTIDGQAGLENQIVRYTYTENDLREKTIIFSGIPGASTHDGGKIAFGPDGFLYATTGDANQPELAQDTTSLAGKILRITSEGEIPTDNPFGNAVYSYGHRNPQGITWDNEGKLWATEHGRSGVQSGYDELNLIVAGGNYGWPEIQGDEEREGMIKPIAHSGPDETWAPAGIAHHEGELFFSGLRGRRLYQATITGNNTVSVRTHFVNEFGRLRATTIANNALYIGTSNRDGRGQPAETDDRLFRVPLTIFRAN
jgi:glucose/arabinose dehydrogenase